MNPLDQGAGGGAAVLNAIKDLPFWLLFAVAVALDAYLLTPTLNADLPKDHRWWVVLLALVFSALAVARGAVLGLQTFKSWSAARDARKRFHTTPVTHQCRWHVAKQPDDSFVTQISAEFAVKNRSPSTLTLLTTRLIRPRMTGEVVQSNVFVQSPMDAGHRTGQHDPDHSIEPGATRPVDVHIMVRGRPNADASKDLLATIGIGDDDGNEQRIEVALRGTPVVAQPKPTQPTESAYSITDPMEKKAVSVLHAELSRYEICGRSAGGFGSVHLEYQGRPLIGFGQDSWTQNSPQNQNIISDPQNVLLKSDNLEALSSLHSSVSDDSAYRLVRALNDRLSPDKGYLRISYFIVCTLWKLGHFQDALNTAKERLPQGEMRDFGMSNILYMLNGLLRYRHPDFTDEMLDQIERFIDGMTEHTFLIREKLSAIRSMRLKSLSSNKAMNPR